LIPKQGTTKTKHQFISMAPSPSSDSSSSLPLAGRTAIVTGASRGIGRAIAAHLSSLGADVIIGYSSNPSHAESLASELTSSRAVPVKADVSDPAAVRSLFDTAESAFGRPVHILVPTFILYRGPSSTLEILEKGSFVIVE
jgi:3-oxoacyl-[acyl-carrier protein] reductase